VSWDEALLVTAGEDGAVFIWDVKDKDAKAAARREQEVRAANAGAAVHGGHCLTGRRVTLDSVRARRGFRSAVHSPVPY
jgi:hypothetical protein